MLKIRLSREGKKNDPVYRLVVSEDSLRPNSRVLGVLGFWHPKAKLVNIDVKSIETWKSKGAQVSPAVKKLLEGTK
ncbi:MAG: 30S ribosomal protein S16 [uncultured bacterium]|nr:MAG: 30S ribosomal protein S16 [uncultured bacterium]